MPSRPEPRFPPRVDSRASDDFDAEKSYYHSDSSGTETPRHKNAAGFVDLPISPCGQPLVLRTTCIPLSSTTDFAHRTSLPLRFPNDTRSVSDPVKKSGVSVDTTSQAMPGSSRMETVKGPPRNSSIDSAISAISTTSSAPKNQQDVSSSPADIAKLVKAAGSPEAVIQYLLKEKQSQSQQNAQLWRLVDKQRAMILGLNKDLERSLKEKEKYRKKLKEVLTLQTTPSVHSAEAVRTSEDSAGSSNVDAARVGPKRPARDVPTSPSAGSDSARPSPIDVSLAPYPITPPADQLSNGPPSAVGEMLDPSHSMPEASQHALDKFDHEAEDREAEARKQVEEENELPLNTPIPPSIQAELQSSAPQGPPPPPPQDSVHPVTDPSAIDDDGLSNFPAPPVPPPRKAPPAPLRLKDAQLSPRLAKEEDEDSDLDSEELLDVDEITTEKRGRRRTRQEDDEMREIIVMQEAEARSLSKKSKQVDAATESPKDILPDTQIPTEPPASTPTMLNRQNAPEPILSLTGVMNGDESSSNTTIRSPGLPASPRPVVMEPGSRSSPLSSQQDTLLAATLSPTAPGQEISLSPNAPLETSPSHEALVLKSPLPLNIVKKKPAEPEPVGTPTSSRESAAERTKIYKGFVTEEYPDLLISPDAVLAINVRVASSRMKPSRASLISLTQLEEDPVFTLAVLSRADGGELWRVEKDSISLAKLDSKLKQCSEFTARAPDRSLFSGHAPAKLDARRRALDQYLEELLNTPFDRTTVMDLCRYLSTNVLPPNADEMGSSTAPDEEGAAKLGPGGRQYKSGYLTKRGKNFGGWKARFFIVEGPLLKYFETPGGAHLGTIKLQGAQIGRQSHQNDVSSPTGGTDEADNQYRHAFLILEPKKKDPSSMTKHVLCAESDKERDLWVNVLLPWTNYKDPVEAVAKRDGQDRQGSSSGHGKGSNTKRKANGQGRSQQQQQQQQQQHAKESEDKLIGVSYETTKQGEIPSSDHAEPSPPAATMSSQPAYSISAPRDPQWIPDPAMVNKMGGLVPSGTDEKKVKKRSFFGFGPKQRSSSDGTDTIFGDNGGASSNGYNGPVRRVFGAPLSDAVRYNSPRDVRVPLPAVVYRCIQYLDARGALVEEGIFRLSGSNVVIKQLKERFDNEGDINLLEDEQYHDIHAVASMLKAYLRELPTSILTRDLHLEFVAVTEMNSQQDKIMALQSLVTRLPLANITLLKYLIAFLIKVINNADRNKMTVRNVGIVFSPTLTIPAPVFALFLQNYQPIFGITPEEYELPSPASLDERHEREQMDASVRPSTSGGMRESPHRHRLAEALADQRRGNTPPPAGFPQLRSTPTPPPLNQRYENPYAQQAASAIVSTRPAYESVVLPPGIDSSQYHLAQQRQGYGTAVYDQPQNYRASRRESSMMMGLPPRGLTPQGSMSRLREETNWQ